MSSGYTHKIRQGDKNFTFKEFAFKCSREFGALISMRDEPMNAKIPDEIKPSDYHQKFFLLGNKEFDRVQAMSDEECQKEANEECETKIDYNEKQEKENNEIIVRYEIMLKEVVAWTPPTPDHTKLKEFMIEQINESIKFDCPIYKDKKSFPITGPQWKQRKLKSLSKSIADHAVSYTDEVKRCKDKTDWIQALKKSL